MSKSETYAADRKIGRLLSDARKNRGVTQADIARKLKKPQSFVSKYENGQRKLMAADLIAVCKAIGLRPTDFFKVYDKT